MIKVKVHQPTPEENKEPQSQLKLKVRRTLAGDYIITDHTDIDIVVKPGEHMISTMGKSEIENTDIVYDAQNRLFKYMIGAGVVDPNSVEGGELYGTIEGSYYEHDTQPNATQVTIFTIGKFIEEERPYFIFRQAQEEIDLKRLSEPDDEYSTELGEIPQAVEKGSINTNDFPTGANYRVYQEHLKKQVKELFTSLKKSKK